MYANGWGVAQSDAEAVKWWRKAADQGFAQAQFSLGYAYDIGQGVPQDHAQAFGWYRLAANQGSAGAQYSLGVMCDKGKGVPQDDVQAYMWFNLAASRSSGEARERAAKNRDRVYERLTFDQRAEGRRLAREWNEAHPRWTGVW